MRFLNRVPVLKLYSATLMLLNRHFFPRVLIRVLEKRLCIGFIRINSAVNLLYVQLRMFDLNGDGKLGLSEMARWVHLRFTSLSIGATFKPPGQQNLQSTKSFFVVCPQALAGPWEFPAEVRGEFPLPVVRCGRFRLKPCSREVENSDCVSSLLLDWLREDYWSSKRCLDIWALTQMHFPACIKSIRISILQFDISLKTLQTPLMCLHVPLCYW